MERWFLFGGIFLCLFALWAVVRHDWLRLTRPNRRIMARVVGHRLHDDADGQSFAPRYRFHDGLAEREVVDQVASASRKPEIGALVELAYPEGRPDLARPPRPLMWCTVYGGLLYGLGVLTAKALGMI